MKESRYFYVPNAGTRTELPEEEARHAVKVLRLTAGDELFLMDGCGTFFRAEVTLASNKMCGYRIIDTLPQETTWNGYIHLAIAPTKMADRMEWLVEKATEVGFDELTFLDCRFSERRHLKEERMEKIAIAAMKQSRKAWKPQLNAMVSFKDFLARNIAGHKFIAHCYDDRETQDFFDTLQKLPVCDEVTVLVGPEGDFSADEVDTALAAGFVPVSLGKSRLRTETAGLAAVMAAQLVKRKK